MGTQLSMPSGKAAGLDKLRFLGKTEFHLVPQITERSFWRMQLALLPCKLIIRALPRALMSPHGRQATWQWAPFQERPQRSLFADKARSRKGGTTPSNTPPAAATPTSSNSWKLWTVGIFAAAFHQCQLSEFRTIILLKCFRCHIYNP